MKKILTSLFIIAALTSCVDDKKTYYQYTVEVTFNNGDVDTITFPLSDVYYVSINYEGCLSAGARNKFVACGVRSFTVLKTETKEL